MARSHELLIDPREVQRPVSEQVELSLTGPRKNVDNAMILGFDRKRSNEGHACFYITASMNLPVLRLALVERELRPVKTESWISTMEIHLAEHRPIVFVGLDYEIKYIKGSRESSVLEINSTGPIELSDVPPQYDYNSYLRRLIDRERLRSTPPIVLG